MKILFFDTETTDLCDFALPPSHESQPDIVQLAGILTDEAGEIECVFDHLITPHTHQISSGAEKIHGITQELANRTGAEPRHAAALFWGHFLGHADIAVAHNIQYDTLLLRTMCHRIDQDLKGTDHRTHPRFTPNLNAWFSCHRTICTMRDSTNFLKLPARNGRKGYKWPNLLEAHQYYLGEGFDSAHDAMADTQACMRIFFEMVKRGEIKL